MRAVKKMNNLHLLDSSKEQGLLISKTQTPKTPMMIEIELVVTMVMGV